MFKLEDIKAGYLLKLEKGKKVHYAAVSNGSCAEGDAGRDGSLGFCAENQESYGELCEFGVDLINKYNNRLRIVAIYGYTHNRFLLDCSPKDRELLWERKEPKKMTVAEICKELGYDVEIVKEG